MKTVMRKSESENRQLSLQKKIARQTEGAGSLIQDNRPQSMAQMKLMESLQAKEDVQLKDGLEEEELPKG